MYLLPARNTDTLVNGTLSTVCMNCIVEIPER